MEVADRSSSGTSPVEFSFRNGLVFQTVLENPSRFNLSATDKLLLQDGRDSMATRTRYGFLIGATLSPLPLFRGQYAINNLRKLPPLMDQQTQRPNPTVIKARLFWIAQSIVLTTLGSGLGTWIGFKLGLKSLERKLNSLPGCLERVMAAFNQAHQELESSSLNHQHQSRSTPDHRNSSVVTSKNSSLNQSEDVKSCEEPEDITSRTVSSHDSSSSNKRNQPAHQSINTSTPSRWEELRRTPQSHPSTWQTIRETNLRSRSSFPSSDGIISPIDSNDFGSRSFNEPFSPPQTQEEFEKLLDSERNLSAGVSPHYSERNSS